jgi:hypothetical protein
MTLPPSSRRWRAAGSAIAGACLLVASGCGAKGAQTATAPPAPPSSSSTPTSSAPPGVAGSALAEFRPCEILSPSDRSSAGLTSTGTEKAIGKTRACDWTEPGAFGVTLTLDESAGLAKLNVAKGAKKTKVGTHQAMEVADRRAGDGTCAVLLAAGNAASVHVDVNNANFGDTDLACQRANTVAKLIEPKLP